MQNLIPGSIHRRRQHPIWNARSLHNYAIPKNFLDGQGVVVSSQLVFAPVVPYAIEGIQLSNNSTNPSTDINISSGFCNTTIGSVYSTQLPTLTKKLDVVWTAGTDNGGRFPGVSLTNTTYHVFALFNPLTEVVDAGFDTSVVAANRPTGWAARRIGSIIRESGTILGFTQVGNYFLLNTVKIDLNSVLAPAFDVPYTLTVPQGLSVITESFISAGLAIGGTNHSIEVRSPGKVTRIPVATPGLLTFRGIVGSLYTANGGVFSSCTSWIRMLTNTSGQLVIRNTSGSYASVGNGVTLQTHGWQDIQLNNGF